MAVYVIVFSSLIIPSSVISEKFRWRVKICKREKRECEKKTSISVRRAAITDFILAQETDSMLSSCAKLKKSK